MLSRKLLSNSLSSLLAAFAFFICFAFVSNASAATYTVDTTTDNVALAACTSAGGDCSLRGAVANANASDGIADTIVFNIPASDANCTAAGVCTITITDTFTNDDPPLPRNDEIIVNATGGALTINGTGANRLIINGGTGDDRIFHINQAIFTLRGVTLTSGGGSLNADSNVYRGYGGAIYADSGTTVISGVNFTGNTGAYLGGGINFFLGENHRVENCTFSGNSATDYGGGIFAQDTNLTVVNTTVSGNTAFLGGGIFFFSVVNRELPLVLRSSTITENTASAGVGGLYVLGTLDFGNNIIAGNTAKSQPEIENNDSTFISRGFNLIGDSAGDSADTDYPVTYQPTDILDTPPLLDVLGNYGGTVPTMRLQPTSPAIDHGNSALAGTPVFDARGVVRPYDIFTTINAAGGNGADIGAFELIPVIQTGWGLNTNGQLGDGTTTDRSLPTDIAGGFTDIVAVEGGANHALGLRADGTLLAWGLNSNGQLGNGTTTNSSTPVAVSGLTNVVATAGGNTHSLALLADGRVMAWGANSLGQLGDGTSLSRTTPVQVSGITNAVAIATAIHSGFALLADGRVMAWGLNNLGQLGDGTQMSPRTTPVQVSGLTGGVIAIDAVNSGGFALLSDGSVRAWGSNSGGSVGDGTTTIRRTPVTPLNLTEGVVQIVGGRQHAAALKADGTLLTWGDNQYGQLGNGTAGGSSSTPTAITLANVVEINANKGYNTYARLRDGRIFVWGINDVGEIGNGTTAASQATPTAVLIDQGIGYFGNSNQTAHAGSPLANVAAGANQFVRLGAATVNFGNVAAAGTMQIRAFDPTATGLNVPAGYTILANSTGYDITSSAQFTDNALVCLKVPNVINQTAFNNLVILHDDNFDGTLDATSSIRNYQKREVCRVTKSFSPFVLAVGLAPTSANISVSGKVLSGKNALAKATVSLTDSSGTMRTVKTNTFGNFSFDGIRAGETVIVQVTAKGYSFAPQIVTVNEDLAGLDFHSL